MIRVLIADDHEVVREGLALLLGADDDLVVVGRAVDGAEAVEAASEHRPDVVLMDLSMPNLDGVEATRRIVEQVPDCRVLVLTSFSDQDRVIEAIDAGATGYLLKDLEAESLRRSVRDAAAGRSPIDSRAASVLLAERTSQRSAPLLTDRETAVLRLVGQGLANKQIALRLGIREATVKNHLTRVFGRLGVTDRTQAALWAERHGLLAADLRGS